MIRVLSYKKGHYNDIGNVGWEYGANSAGGWDFTIDFKNDDESKTIKYATFIVTAYNRVGDKVECTVRNISTARLKYTGPLAPGSIAEGVYWETVFYNNSISEIKLEGIEIDYMDGTSETQTTNLERNPLPPSPTANTSSGGCYVATAVYGSYDCPQVWTLRRYRDNTLAATWYGRAFIHTYYAISPTLVKWFGDSAWFINMWKPKLDRMVEDLHSQGVEDTPYNDRNW